MSNFAGLPHLSRRLAAGDWDTGHIWMLNGHLILKICCGIFTLNPDRYRNELSCRRPLMASYATASDRMVLAPTVRPSRETERYS